MTNWLRKTVCGLAAAALCSGVLARGAQAATSKEVNDAIEKAKAYLYSQMKDGNWEYVPKPEMGKDDSQVDPKGHQFGGLTAIATYALLASGENPQSPKLKPAIEWLKKAPINSTYACALRAQVWLFVSEKEAKADSQSDFTYMLQAIHDKQPHLGLYPYYLMVPADRYGTGQVDLKAGKPQDWSDHSNGQYGVLGTWACEQVGNEVPLRYWQIVDARWKADQQANGGWFYNKDNNQVSGTMTAAGLATLYITQDYLLQSNNWGTCKGGVRNENIERGLKWMDAHAPAMLKEGNNYFYGMYGIERIGVASGRKYFGTTDWYKEGAEQLVRKQGGDGSWGGEGIPFNPKKVPDTCFATLFLVRGRAPVLMNKLEYANGGEANAPAAPAEKDGKDGKDGKPEAKPAPKPEPRALAGGKKQDDPWNERPRDAANFTHWASRMTERYLNWQIVNLKVSPDDLHDAPILFIAGSEPLNLGEAEVNKLREFVEDGGLILGNADCGNALFAKSFEALGRKLFPKYEFRDLPLTHPIYTDEQFHPTKWRVKPHMLGLSNGVRELMILIPEADPARRWQTRSEKTQQEMFEVVQDIFMYTISKSELRYRGETYIVHADPGVQADKTVKVVRVLAGDNPDPEPGAWRRLANVLHNTAKVNVEVSSAKLGEGKLAGAQLAALTGTTKFTLRPEQRKELKDFVDNGGTLVVDAAGGSREFADSAEAELAAVFGAKSGGDILDPTADVYTAGQKTEKFNYRNYVKGRITGKLSVPRVHGIKVGNRVGVFYSAEDLTAGLVGQPTDGILGYAPDTATDIMRNIVVYAARNGGNVAKAADK